MACRMLPNCPFFNDRMQGHPAVARMFKSHYCLGDPSGCARLMVRNAKGKGAVPASLYPNETSRAARLILGAADSGTLRASRSKMG